MIAVTCRNGEHFSVDPLHIERIETSPDTVIHLVDGTKYVVDLPFDDLLRTISDHRALLVVARQRLYGGVAEIAERRPSMRIERRARSRDGDSAYVRPDPADPAPAVPGDDED
ncbi:MAG TPA: flagellar FlbD family protein [Blastococcus sp.]|nr:flagellar FlbD family protein [Blastococcus sp.]